MENATEALIISGAILIAVILFGLLVFAFSNASNLQRQESKEQDVEALARWNAEWESYNRKILYGADIINLKNKAEQYEEDEEEYKVKIKILTKDDEEVEGDEVSKNSIYECVEFKYSKETGRVETITFRLIE